MALVVLARRLGLHRIPDLCDSRSYRDQKRRPDFLVLHGDDPRIDLRAYLDMAMGRVMWRISRAFLNLVHVERQMTEWTAADLEQNRRIDDLARAIAELTEHVATIEARLAPWDDLARRLVPVVELFEKLKGG